MGVQSVRRVEVLQENSVMVYLSNVQEYSTDALPEWLQPLRVILEDMCFVALMIQYDEMLYRITVKDE